MDRGLIWRLPLALIILGIPVLLLVLVASQDDSGPIPEYTQGGCKTDERQALRVLKPEVKEYARISGARATGRPRVAAGIVVLDGRRIDKDVYCALPRKLQARSPQQVRTVVSIEYDDEVVGHYTGGGDAIRTDAEVTIIDLKSKKHYPSKVFLGDDPPDVVETYGEGDVTQEGDPPTRKIVRYLRRLAPVPET